MSFRGRTVVRTFTYMQIITSWLSGPQNFITGRIMYNTVGNDQGVKDLISRGETPFARKLLTEAFEKLIADSSQLKANPADAETEVMEDSFDEVLQSLKEKWVKPYQQMNYLRHQLDTPVAPALKGEESDQNSIEAINHRKLIASKILDLEQECIQVWNERDYYLKHGKLANVAEAKLIIPTDPIKLANLISNTTKNIRRNRKAMADHPAQPQFAQLYNEYKGKYKQITGKDYDEKN